MTSELIPQAGLGIVPALCARDPPPGGGGCDTKIPHAPTSPRALIPGPKSHFSAKTSHCFLAQKWSKNGPKVVKNDQNCPQNRRNKLPGGGQEIRTNPQNIGKMAKNAPPPQCKMKMHQKSKNGYKLAKIGKKCLKKSIFPTTTSQKRPFPSKKHKKKYRLRWKKMSIPHG